MPPRSPGLLPPRTSGAAMPPSSGTPCSRLSWCAPASCSRVSDAADDARAALVQRREALEKLLPQVPLALFDRVLAADPGSTDGTLDVYEAHGIPYVLQTARDGGHAFLQAPNLAETKPFWYFTTEC